MGEIGPVLVPSELEIRGFLVLALSAVQKFSRASISEPAVWPTMVVVVLPRLDLAPRILDRQELIRVEALISKLPVEGLDEAVLHGLSRLDEIEQYTA